MNETPTIQAAEEVTPFEETTVDAPLLRQLSAAADIAAAWEFLPRPNTPSSFPKRVEAARQALREMESRLAREPLPPPVNDPAITARRSALLELGASHRMFRSVITAVADDPRGLARLPRLQPAPAEDEPRIAGVARVYLETVEGLFSASTLQTFIHDLQAHELLNVDELWQIGTFLKFVMLETLLEESRALLQGSGAGPAPLLVDRIKSMRAITHADWVFLIEPLIVFDTFLKQDPTGAYAAMDFESREMYRRRVAEVARRSDAPEIEVAKVALDLAEKAQTASVANARSQCKREHVGFYLIDRGFRQLADRVGFHPSPSWRARQFVRTHAQDFFLNGIVLLTVLFVFAVLFPVLPQIDGFGELIAVLVLLCLPASQDAVDLINNAITAYFDPEPLPKLDFSEGIPAECSTLVAVPTLLLNENQVRRLVNDIEVRFLANRDPNLHFALLTDLADSASKPREKDFHPLVELAIHLVDELNAKYASRSQGSFLLLHRHRIFNTRQGVWMGWERKRGKLLDLNKLLTHKFDAFPIKAGPVEVLDKTRYVITLDSDSQLPYGTAARLVGAIAHPLNRAIIDPKRRIVTEGFGILQPRVGVSVRSTASSRLAAIYTGRGGLDLYTRAISDAYQDLFGEGIFTGKGIYEVAAVQAVLDRRFPRDSLLSHDLIEGAYARAGLLADVELIDDYPSHSSAYLRRKHRWLRGDWQIAQWVFSRVPDESGSTVVNPISSISRWKIFDNLRRSLVDPAFFVLFLAGWCFLPGGAFYWTIAPVLLLFFPTIAQFLLAAGRAAATRNRGQMGEAVCGLQQASMISLLRLAFLPHETLLALDAIVRALARRFITGERLLEWETAAQSEMRTGHPAPAERYLAATPMIAGVAGVLVLLLADHAWDVLFALPVLALWAFAPPITNWLNQPPREKHHLPEADREFLRAHALRIWRYFFQFSNEHHHYLIPDNVMEDGLREAARVSPTNIGLLLNARQAANELGFITPPEFVSLSGSTLGTIAGMEKYRGHLYNWYDTATLKPLDDSPFVSSVDSGNLVASLFTLHTGALSLTARPLLKPELFDGLATHLRILCSEMGHPQAISRLAMPGPKDDLPSRIGWLSHAKTFLKETCSMPSADPQVAWWMRETGHRIEAIDRLLQDYLPWLKPQFAALRGVDQFGINRHAFDLNCSEAIEFAEELRFSMTNAHRILTAEQEISQAREQLLDLLPQAIHNLKTLLRDLEQVAKNAEHLAQEMDFSFLVDPSRRILSIGFEMGPRRRHASCYDLVASEARIATFLAVARGDIPPQSWLKLGREHTFAYGRFLLLSWSGTMFEYLMPALWMRAYSGTTIARTQEACVKVQQEFGRERGIPWGISESGASRVNDRGDYHYFAYGIPRLSLWFEATAGPVISPYSTFLALPVDPSEALHNLRRMQAESWTGAYGFYEAADFSTGSRGPVLVKEWMTHHLGMSLLAVVNLLRDNVVQEWFHRHPQIQAAEMLLQEMPVGKSILKAQLKEIAPIQSNVKAFSFGRLKLPKVTSRRRSVKAAL